MAYFRDMHPFRYGRHRRGNFNHPDAAGFTMYRDHVVKSEVRGYASHTGGRGMYLHAAAVRMSDRRWRGMYLHTAAVRMSERRWRGLYMHTEAVCRSDRRWRGLYMHLVKRFAHSGVNTD